MKAFNESAITIAKLNINKADKHMEITKHWKKSIVYLIEAV